jgi:hypothetical protein
MEILNGGTALTLAICAALAAAGRPERPAPICDGKMVSAIDITPRDPSFVAVPHQLRGVARAIGVIHTTSTRQTISHFLLL